jgi:hypothetical protein
MPPVTISNRRHKCRSITSSRICNEMPKFGMISYIAPAVNWNSLNVPFTCYISSSNLAGNQFHPPIHIPARFKFSTQLPVNPSPFHPCVHTIRIKLWVITKPLLTNFNAPACGHPFQKQISEHPHQHQSSLQIWRHPRISHCLYSPSQVSFTPIIFFPVTTRPNSTPNNGTDHR